MTRRLTGDERQLWETLRRSVRPLRPAPEPVPDAPSAFDLAPDRRLIPGRAGPSAKAPPERSRAVPPLAVLDERVRRRLARGLVEVDARIDLHGMHQERAFAALMSFLHRNQARGARLVLVITGKGRAEEGGRGVLRHSVPAWLARPELRDLVVGFEETARRQGGAGALYVRLRRRRDALEARAGE